MSDDGKALQAVDHPVEIQVTEAMLEAGRKVVTSGNSWDFGGPGLHLTDNHLRDIFIAMVEASPQEPEISEDALEEMEISISPRFAELAQYLRGLARLGRDGARLGVSAEKLDEAADILEAL